MVIMENKMHIYLILAEIADDPDILIKQLQRIK